MKNVKWDIDVNVTALVLGAVAVYVAYRVYKGVASVGEDIGYAFTEVGNVVKLPYTAAVNLKDAHVDFINEEIADIDKVKAQSTGPVGDFAASTLWNSVVGL